MSNQKSQRRASKCKVNQITGKSIGRPLDRCAGLFSLLNRFDDLAESRIPSNTCVRTSRNPDWLIVPA